MKLGGSILGNCQGNKNFTSSVGCCLQQSNNIATFVSSWRTKKIEVMLHCSNMLFYMPSRLESSLCNNFAVGPITLTCRRTPHRFLLTANEPPVQEFCTIAQGMWIAAEEVKTSLPCFGLLGKISVNILLLILPASQCLLEKSTFL
jgi:hypothetical protein